MGALQKTKVCLLRITFTSQISVDLFTFISKSMDWFLYDRDPRHERVKEILNRKLYFFRSGVGGRGIIIALLQRNIALTIYPANIQFALVMTMRAHRKISEFPLTYSTLRKRSKVTNRGSN